MLAKTSQKYAMLLSLLLLASPSAAHASSEQCDVEQAKRDVLAQDARRINALLHNDVETLESITDQDYTHVESTAATATEPNSLKGAERARAVLDLRDR